MKTIQRKCRGGYQHYFERVSSDCRKKNDQGVWERKIRLGCVRCSLTVYIDSVIRPSFDVKSENDWGT